EGDEVAAYVSVRPFGKDSRDVAINMSIDEAEELARQLLALVTDAREGRFMEDGVKVAEDMRLQDLKEAWLVLGIEDLNNGGEFICVGALNGFGPPRVGVGDGPGLGSKPFSRGGWRCARSLALRVSCSGC